jgi:PAS domain S-box-containing protein
MPDTGLLSVDRASPAASFPALSQPRVGPAGRWLALLLGAVLLMMAGGFHIIYQRDYAMALEDGWHATDRAAFAAGEHAKRGLSAARLVTDWVAGGARRDGLAAFDGPSGEQDFAALLRHLPQISAIRLLDAAGRDAAGVVEAGAAPFLAPGNGAEAALGPLRLAPQNLDPQNLDPQNLDPNDGGWFMSFDRAVRDGQGRLLGIVQARIEPHDFRRVTARLGLGDGGRVGLFRAADGVPLMLHPLPPAGAPATSPLPLPAGADGREGRFEATMAGGERLLVSWRLLGGDLPVLAVAALPRATALAASTDRLARNAALFGLAVALVCLLGWAIAMALARGARDRAAAEAGRSELQAVLEATAEGVFAVDPDWRITFVNRQAAAMFGSGPDLVGVTLWRAFSSPIPAPFEAAYRQAMAMRQAVSAEGDCPMAGRRLRIDIQPRGDGGLVAFLRDITAAEEAARRIAESEARLRRVLDNLFAFVGVLAPDGTLMEANRAPLDAVGATLEELRGRPFWDCPWWSRDPAAQTRIREACARAAAGGVLRFDMPLRLPGGRRMTLDFQIAPLRGAGGRITHLIPSATDVTARIAAEDALADSAMRLRLAQDAAEIGVFERRVRDGDVHWSASMFRLYGLDPAGRGPWVAAAEHLALVHPADREAHRARCMARAADPSLTRYEDEFRIRRADTGEVRCIASRGEILRDADGQALVVRGVNFDVTERRRAEGRQLLLAREVDHRAKNALAVVQSIIALTRDADPERFRAAVTGRIAALARAHTLLARDGWNSAGLRELVEEEVAPYRGGAEAPERVTLEGPEVALAPGAAQPLAMALHELATNAAKHGALSAPGGRIAIRWQAMENGGLLLRWSETRPEPLSGPPTRRGFGYSVIRNTVERQLGGLCAFEWREEGLAFRIELPASQLRWPAGTGGGG